MTRRHSLGLAAVAAFTVLTSCTTQSYMGIPLVPGQTDALLQQVATRAQTGDKQAQLELGIMFEEGRGVGQDLTMAKDLYRLAAADSRETMWIYSPSPGGGAPSRVLPVKRPFSPGLTDARVRLESLLSAPDSELMVVAARQQLDFLLHAWAWQNSTKLKEMPDIEIKRPSGLVRVAPGVALEETINNDLSLHRKSYELLALDRDIKNANYFRAVLFFSIDPTNCILDSESHGGGEICLDEKIPQSKALSFYFSLSGGRISSMIRGLELR